MFKYIALACLLGVSLAAPNDLGYAAIDQQDNYPRYGFNYGVNDPHTGDHKTQQEHRENGVVHGSYSVAEPDGTVRVVDYSADPHTGFNAKVRRIGKPVYADKRGPVIPAAPIASVPLIGSGLGLGAGLGYSAAIAHGAGLGQGVGLAHGAGIGHGLKLGYVGLGQGLGLGAYSLGLH